MLRLSLAIACLLAGGCNLKNASIRGFTNRGCLAPAAWVPTVVGMGPSNADGSVQVVTREERRVGPLVGLAQGFSDSQELTFPVRATALGAQGSFTLMAEPAAMPSGVQGQFYPVLVKLTKGGPAGRDLVGLDPVCRAQGLFECSTGSPCVPNPRCKTSNGVFADYGDLLTRQVTVGFGYASTVTFPRCNGPAGPGRLECGLYTYLSPPGGRVEAVEYNASYVLLASDYESAPIASAEMRLNVIQKKDDAQGGGMALNFIFVGQSNRESAQSAVGKTKLDQIAQEVFNTFSNESRVRLTSVTAYDYTCDGEEFSSASVGELATLFEKGSGSLPAAEEGKSMNIFFVDAITEPSVPGTIVGLSGAIGGPPLWSTGSSGVAVTVNPDFDGMTAADRYEVATTIVHELGHFLGLYHLTESGGPASGEDVFIDTPTCPAPVTRSACRAANPACAQDLACTTVCPSNDACPYNHAMWFTLKTFSPALADSNMFSPDSGKVIHWSPYVR